MRNIKLTIEYDGTEFNGWQIQDKGKRTVQGVIEAALKKIFREKIKLYGSGRTDSGVHALGQVANFKVDSKKSCPEIVRALNGNLPKDVSILHAADVKDDFHAQFSAKRKKYRYTILSRKEPGPVSARNCFHYPYPLNLQKMRRMAKKLVGRHDFRAFMAMDARQRANIQSKDTKRTIYQIQVQKAQNFITIDIEANGFLYKMVRNIVGTLLWLSNPEISKSNILAILKSKDRSLAGDTAPAKGLCLIQVNY